MDNISEEAWAVGFDIGGTTTKLGLVSNKGLIRMLEVFPTDVQTIGLEVFLNRFLVRISGLIADSKMPISGIGGTFLGWIDPDRSGPFLCFNAMQLHGFDLRQILVEKYGLPVVLIDDTNAHTLAEYTFGSGRSFGRFMNLAMGTGLSAGAIINGKLLDFTGGCIGDSGHIILRPGGPSCSAGCKGCAEALIGVAGIERLALEISGQNMTAREVIALSRQADPSATAVMRQIGEYTGELLASLSHIFLPERISLSGGTSNAGNVLLDAVRERFEFD